MDFKALFDKIHPGFFEQEYIKGMSDNVLFSELVLDLHKDKLNKTGFNDDGRITFGEYHGELSLLHDAIQRVESDWVQYFTEYSRTFCAFDGDRIVAFCGLTNMGTFDGIKIGGPGCVGTIPDYRKQGIGLEMVKRATEIFMREGYDLSWIHFTYLEDWYSKLGYRTVLKWDNNGIVLS
ncbi:MAG: GNAT family N-acetyltransferase [Lachnospiraceae bacterium]|nr:GNAT family N-acetyltransferase [Lachnospiraceae bacterium]